MKTVTLAVLALLSAAAHAASQEPKSAQDLSRDSEAICRYESTKRGELDSKRLEYCLASHAKWAITIERFSTENNEDFYKKFSYPYCYEKSTRRGVTNAGLLYSCLSTEIDAHKDVIYYMGQLGKEKVIPIIRSELGKYGSWNMVRFKVKNDLDPHP